MQGTYNPGIYNRIINKWPNHTYITFSYVNNQETSLYMLFISGQERRAHPPIGQVGAVAGTGHEEEGGILNRR